MTAKVGKKLSTFVVNGKKLKVVKITHRGRYTTSARKCGQGKWGPVFLQYLYSPKLGFYVRQISKSFHTGNKNRRKKLYFGFDRKMVSFVFAK